MLDAADAARRELRNFAATEPPKATVYRGLKFGVCVYNIRFIMERQFALNGRLPSTMAPTPNRTPDFTESQGEPTLRGTPGAAQSAQ